MEIWNNKAKWIEENYSIFDESKDSNNNLTNLNSTKNQRKKLKNKNK